MKIFLDWLARAAVISPLHVAWVTRGARAAPLAEDERFAILRRLLHHQHADSRDRLAGCLLLLYGQPLMRTVCLRTSDITTSTDHETAICLARGRVTLPRRWRWSGFLDVGDGLSADAGRTTVGAH